MGKTVAPSSAAACKGENGLPASGMINVVPRTRAGTARKFESYVPHLLDKIVADFATEPFE